MAGRGCTVGTRQASLGSADNQRRDGIGHFLVDASEDKGRYLGPDTLHAHTHTHIRTHMHTQDLMLPKFSRTE